jgi:hypothetical protein
VAQEICDIAAQRKRAMSGNCYIPSTPHPVQSHAADVDLVSAASSPATQSPQEHLINRSDEEEEKAKRFSACLPEQFVFCDPPGTLPSRTPLRTPLKTLPRATSPRRIPLRDVTNLSAPLEVTASHMTKHSPTAASKSSVPPLVLVPAPAPLVGAPAPQTASASAPPIPSSPLSCSSSKKDEEAAPIHMALLSAYEHERTHEPLESRTANVAPPLSPPSIASESEANGRSHLLLLLLTMIIKVVILVYACYLLFLPHPTSLRSDTLRMITASSSSRVASFPVNPSIPPGIFSVPALVSQSSSRLPDGGNRERGGILLMLRQLNALIESNEDY